MTAQSKRDLKDKYQKCKLKNGKTKPDSWFTELETLVARLAIEHNHVISEQDQIKHILGHMPKDYDSLIMAIERDMNQGDDPTLERIKADVREMYTLH